MEEPRRLPGIKAFNARKDAWIESLGSWNTRQAYGRDLEVFAAWMTSLRRSPLTATAADLDEFRDACEVDGVGAATLNRRLAALSTFFRYLDPRAAANPALSTRRSDATAGSTALALTAAEVDAVWAAARRLGHKTEALIALILFDRFKSSDLLPLDVENISFGRWGATINLPGGTDTTQRIALDARTAEAVRRYRADRRDGPLLMGDNPTRRGSRLTRFGVDYLVKKVGQAAELSFPLTVNALRVSAASQGPTASS